MTPLTDMQCEACRADAPPVPPTEYAQLLQQIPHWHLVQLKEDISIPTLVRTFTFANWRTAFAFAEQVSSLAEAQGHHPRMQIDWGRVQVGWWTHKIKSLHRNDFVCAAHTDALYAARA